MPVPLIASVGSGDFHDRAVVCKGLQLDDDSAARRIIDAGGGLFSNRGRNLGAISVSEITELLTQARLNLM